MPGPYEIKWNHFTLLIYLQFHNKIENIPTVRQTEIIKGTYLRFLKTQYATGQRGGGWETKPPSIFKISCILSHSNSITCFLREKKIWFTHMKWQCRWNQDLKGRKSTKKKKRKKGGQNTGHRGSQGMDLELRCRRDPAFWSQRHLDSLCYLLFSLKSAEIS